MGREEGWECALVRFDDRERGRHVAARRLGHHGTKKNMRRAQKFLGVILEASVVSRDAERAA